MVLRGNVLVPAGNLRMDLGNRTGYAIWVRKNRIGRGAEGYSRYLFRCGPPKTGADPGFHPAKTPLRPASYCSPAGRPGPRPKIQEDSYQFV